MPHDPIDQARERFVRSGIVALVAAVLALIAMLTWSADASATPGVGAWGARVVVPGTFSGMTAAGGSLYAVREAASGPPARGTRVVRIDARSGRVLATSAVFPGVGSPLVVGGSLWLAGVTFVSRDARREGPPVLDELNPRTLQRERTVALAGNQDPEMAGGPGGILWTAQSTTSGCLLRRLDPLTGAALPGDRSTVGTGPCAGITVDTSGASLYVVSGPAGPVADGLYRLDARTGLVTGETSVPPLSVDMVLAATAGGLWISGGEPGTNGSLLFFSTSPLRLTSASTEEGGRSNTELGGATGPSLPTFGQFPVVDLSGGTVWVGSDGLLACLDPTDDTELASISQRRAPVVTGALTDVAGSRSGMWAIAGFSAPGPDAGLARLDPPAACSA